MKVDDVLKLTDKQLLNMWLESDKYYEKLEGAKDD